MADDQTIHQEPDEAALLKAIADHPGEDTPRLMYADWLQEQGEEEQAAFIRLQIEAARIFIPPVPKKEISLEELAAYVLPKDERLAGLIRDHITIDHYSVSHRLMDNFDPSDLIYYLRDNAEHYDAHAIEQYLEQMQQERELHATAADQARAKIAELQTSADQLFEKHGVEWVARLYPDGIPEGMDVVYRNSVPVLEPKQVSVDHPLPDEEDITPAMTTPLPPHDGASLGWLAKGLLAVGLAGGVVATPDKPNEKPSARTKISAGTRGKTPAENTNRPPFHYLPAESIIHLEPGSGASAENIENDDKLETKVEILPGNTLNIDLLLWDKDQDKRYLVRHHTIKLPVKVDSYSSHWRQNIKLWAGPDGYEMELYYSNAHRAQDIASQIARDLKSAYWQGDKAATKLISDAYRNIGIDKVPHYRSGEIASLDTFMKQRRVRELAVKAETSDVARFMEILAGYGSIKSEVAGYGKEGMAQWEEAEKLVAKALKNMAKKDYTMATRECKEAALVLEKLSAFEKMRPPAKNDTPDSTEPVETGIKNFPEGIMQYYRNAEISGGGFSGTQISSGELQAREIPVKERLETMAKDLQMLSQELPAYLKRVQAVQR